MSNFEMTDYKEVAERLRDLFAKHPNASMGGTYEIVEVAGAARVIYRATCHREPNDPNPGVGTAWEDVPGRTPYTKGSELQNAETSAWGRAIVAVGASESKRIASADEMRSARAREEAPPERPPPADKERIDALVDEVGELKLGDWVRDQGFLWPWTAEACLAGDTRVLLADGGSLAIAEMARRGGDWAVLAESDGCAVPAIGTRARITGRRPVMRLLLADGASLRCTDDHQVLTLRGFVPAGQLASGDVLPCVPRANPPNRSAGDAIPIGDYSANTDTRTNGNHVALGEFRRGVQDASLGRSPHAALAGGVGHVVSMASGPQVARPNAGRGVAGMADEQTLRDRAVSYFVREAMGVDEFAVDDDLSVAPVVLRSRPYPAAVALGDPRPESLGGGWRSKVIQAGAVSSRSSRSGVPPAGVVGSTPAARLCGARASVEGAVHQISIDAIETTGELEFVYDLTVPHHHNFAVTGGVFVHNCDAIAEKIGLTRAKPPETPPESPATPPEAADPASPPCNEDAAETATQPSFQATQSEAVEWIDPAVLVAQQVDAMPSSAVFAELEAAGLATTGAPKALKKRLTAHRIVTEGAQASPVY